MAEELGLTVAVGVAVAVGLAEELGLADAVGVDDAVAVAVVSGAAFRAGGPGGPFTCARVAGGVCDRVGVAEVPWAPSVPAPPVSSDVPPREVVELSRGTCVAPIQPAWVSTAGASTAESSRTTVNADRVKKPERRRRRRGGTTPLAEASSVASRVGSCCRRLSERCVVGSGRP